MEESLRDALPASRAMSASTGTSVDEFQNEGLRSLAHSLQMNDASQCLKDQFPEITKNDESSDALLQTSLTDLMQSELYVFSPVPERDGQESKMMWCRVFLCYSNLQALSLGPLS